MPFNAVDIGCHCPPRRDARPTRSSSAPVGRTLTRIGRLALAALLAVVAPTPAVAGAVMPPTQAADPAADARSLGAIPAPVRSVTSTQSDFDHPVSHLVDGNPGRPWIAAQDTQVGAIAVMRFDTVRWLGEVEIVAGHARDPATYQAHPRPAVVELSWAGRTARLELRDTRAAQRFSLGPIAITDQIVLRVADVRGPSHGGVALSQVSFFEATATSGVDAGARDQVEALLAELEYPSRRPAALAKLRAVSGQVIPILLVHATTRGAPVRVDALRLVVDANAEQGQRVLRALLDSDAIDDLIVALDALPPGGAEDHRDALEALLDSPLAALRQRALALLASAERRGGWRALLEARLADRNGDVRLEALAALAGVAEPWAAERLIAHLHGASLREAQVALRLLLDRDAPPFGVVARVIIGSHADRAAALVSVLGERPGPESTGLLVDLLVAAAPGLQRPLHLALDAHGDAAVQTVIERVEADRRVGPSAYDFLVARGARAGALAGAALRRHLDERAADGLLATYIEVIGIARATEHRALVREAFLDTSRHDIVRKAALVSLARLGDDSETFDIVRRQLAGPRTILRTAAYEAASELGRRDLAPLIHAHLEASRARLWDPVAVAAYARLGGGPALSYLRTRYEHTNRQSRAVILEAAHRAGTRDDIELLVGAVAGTDHMLRGIARRHLTQGAPP